MNRLLAAAGLLLALDASATERREVGPLVFDGVPERSPEVAARLAPYLNVRGATLVDWTADGAMLVLTRFGDTTQLHRVDAPAAYRRQLSFFDEPVRGALALGSDSRQVLLTQDAGGGEFYQLGRLDLNTGRTTLLTDGRSRNEAPVLSRRGDRVAYVSTRRNGKDFDLWVQKSDDPASARMVAELEGQWTPLDWSPDTESTLHVVDVATGSVSRVRRTEAPVSYGTARFVDGRSIVATSDEQGEFETLVRIDLATSELRPLLHEARGDVTLVERSHDGKTLAWVVNEGGTSALWVGPSTAPSKARRARLPVGVVSGLRFDRTGRKLGLSMTAATAPDDAYALDVKSGTLTRWTFSEVGGLDPAGFVTPELVRYPGFEGRPTPAWYYRAAKGEGPRPVIISIHGGPESQSTAGFGATAQFWARELGAAVLLPNVRGSSGYGKSALKLDDGFHREDSVKDIGALLDWVATRPELDASRVAVIGGSYGGYMTLASLVQFGDRLRCGVDIVGISHFVTFLEHTEGYRRDLRRVEYGDERDPAMRAFLEGISPLTNAAKIRRPLFVVQGANDPRVPASEAEQIVRTVREGGGDVWYLLAKDEGHGFVRKKNRDAYLQAVTQFFEKHLLP